jgi:O-antigen/teichoic acid export membrane protein
MMAIGGYAFFALGVPRSNFEMNLVRLLAFAVSVVPLAAWIGLKGVALAVVLSFVAMVPVNIRGMKKVLGVSVADHRLTALNLWKIEIVRYGWRAKR